MNRFWVSLSLLLSISAGPARADVDRCLVGTWVADISDIADMMTLQMNGDARATGGQVTMEIAPGGDFTILADALTIAVTVPDTPAIDVMVVGYSAGTMDASDDIFLLSVSDYNLSGSADVLGQRMEIPFDSETGLLGGGSGQVRCAGDALHFEGMTGDVRPPQMPRNWARIG